MGIDNKYMALTGKRNGTLNIRTNDYLYDLAGAAIVSKNLVHTGYIKYANGLIIQWGGVNLVPYISGEQFTVDYIGIPYPIIFNKIIHVFLTPIGHNIRDVFSVLNVGATGLNQFDLRAKGTTSSNLPSANWLAIGC